MSLLTPREVDVLFRYPAGRTARLAKAGRIAFILLPDGEMRFDESEIRKLLSPHQNEPKDRRELACA